MLARDVVTWAKSHRPRVQVKADGFVNRLYRYWQTQSGKNLPPTNACPYLRRALIYAPLYAAHNALWAGPRVRGHRVPVLLVVLASTTVASLLWQYGHTAVAWAAIIGAAIYVIAGLVMGVYACGWVLENLDIAKKRLEIKWFEDNPYGHEFAVAPWILVFSPVVLACMIVVLVAILVVGLGIFGTMIYLTDKTELDFTTKFKAAMSKHPRKAPWLCGWLALVPPVVWWAVRFHHVVLLLIGIGVVITVTLAVWGLAEYDKRVAKPRKERAKLAAAVAKAEQLKLRRSHNIERLRLLYETIPFRDWLWLSNHLEAEEFRERHSQAMIRDFRAGRFDPSSFESFLDRVGYDDMLALEYWYVRQFAEAENETEARELPDLPPPPQWLEALAEKLGRWLALPGVLTWRFAKTIWEIVAAVFALLYSLKILGLCPAIEIVGSQEESTTTRETGEGSPEPDGVYARMHEMLCSQDFLSWLWDSDDPAAVDFRQRDALGLSHQSVPAEWFEVHHISYLLLLEEWWHRARERNEPDESTMAAVGV